MKLVWISESPNPLSALRGGGFGLRWATHWLALRNPRLLLMEEGYRSQLLESVELSGSGPTLWSQADLIVGILYDLKQVNLSPFPHL